MSSTVRALIGVLVCTFTVTTAWLVRVPGDGVTGEQSIAKGANKLINDHSLYVPDVQNDSISDDDIAEVRLPLDISDNELGDKKDASYSQERAYENLQLLVNAGYIKNSGLEGRTIYDNSIAGIFLGSEAGDNRLHIHVYGDRQAELEQIFPIPSEVVFEQVRYSYEELTNLANEVLTQIPHLVLVGVNESANVVQVDIDEAFFDKVMEDLEENNLLEDPRIVFSPSAPISTLLSTD